MSVVEHYLSVEDSARDALAVLGLDVTYGALLADGSTVGKVWVEELPELPPGVEDLGTDGAALLELLAPAPEGWP
jgi:hypothetical protein